MGCLTHAATQGHRGRRRWDDEVRRPNDEIRKKSEARTTKGDLVGACDVEADCGRVITLRSRFHFLSCNIVCYARTAQNGGTERSEHIELSFASEWRNWGTAETFPTSARRHEVLGFGIGRAV